MRFAQQEQLGTAQGRGMEGVWKKRVSRSQILPGPVTRRRVCPEGREREWQDQMLEEGWVGFSGREVR